MILDFGVFLCSKSGDGLVWKAIVLLAGDILKKLSNTRLTREFIEASWFHIFLSILVLFVVEGP